MSEGTGSETVNAHLDFMDAVQPMFRRPGQVTDVEWVRLVAYFFGHEVAAEEMKKMGIQQIVEIRRIVPNTD